VLDAMAAALHRIQVRQLVPSVADGEGDGRIDIAGLAGRVHPELVQLWYQMALSARRDLPLAPAPRTGFEMGVLRMLAFRPEGNDAAEPDAGSAPAGTPAPRRRPGDAAAAARAALQASAPAGSPARAESTAPAQRTVPPDPRRTETPDIAPTRPTPMRPAPARADSPRTADVADVAVAPSAPAPPAPATPPRDGGVLPDADAWLAAIESARLGGPVRELAAHAVFVGHADGILRLAMQPEDEHLQVPSLVDQLAQALAPRLGAVPRIRFESAPATGETLHQRQSRARDARQAQAEADFERDPGVQALVGRHGARIVPDSIRPLDATG
jgi:DNA polymerase-3 subunit gamma/tau